MTTRLKASLEAAIQKWSEKECESADWEQAEVWWPPSLVPSMAEAAYQVMKANINGQQFAKEQGN